jgi:cellulose synthase/poly-beta-1,6-N-acetylglucosamine synthase-like glycosyltransferase
VDGKFHFVEDEKLYVRGVTYGTFQPENGSEYPSHDSAELDFRAMAAQGINALRTYTVPPRCMLDLAYESGLCVLVGLAWEQHVAFLDDPGRARSIEGRVREDTRSCAGHPAVLGYAVGNEIPASIVRWHGRRRVERFLERLTAAVRSEDPSAPVTYVNYPSTEYLQLPFLDFLCFNVFLEAEERLEAYIARLQHLAGDRPLVLTELGFDSRRHGEDAQAVVLDWQIRTAFRAGCAGVFVFSWTDEWHRGGMPVDDWDFGVTDRRRRPKPGLGAMRNAFADVPFRDDIAWPRISVVICSHNGATTIADCLEGVAALDYPDFETFVVDDGSTDETSEIAERFDVRLIRTENRGLSSARNTGLEAASGEIVAYLDDDACPDIHWLRYVAATFMATPHAGVGGPNVPPRAEGLLGACMAEAPGGPIHVLLSDREAEHIPGCNMAFRKSALEAVGGFDPRFTAAGDDVDMCWRLHDRGSTLGFNPAAMVWHRPRRSLGAYMRQQHGYGAAEALLERKWPERYNRGGHLHWSGHVYGGRMRRAMGFDRWRIYYGTWGHGLFQSVYQRSPGVLSSLPLMPEWYLLLALLAAVSAYGLFFEPLLFRVPILGMPFAPLLFTLSAVALVGQAFRSALAALAGVRGSRGYKGRFLAVMTLLFLVQPAARLAGRLRRGLTPWRRRRVLGFTFPWWRSTSVWSEWWRSPSEWMHLLQEDLRRTDSAVYRGGDYDRWDLEVRVGPLASARLRMAVEEHGQGMQLLRVRVWPVWSRLLGLLGAVLAVWLMLELLKGRTVATIVAVFAALVLVRAVREGGAAVGLLLERIAVLSSVSADEQQREEPEAELPDLDAALAPRVATKGSRTAAVNGDGSCDPHVARSSRGNKSEGRV